MRIIKLPAVENKTGKKRTQIYEAVAKGTFPKPVKIGPRAVGWVEEEIDQWIESRIAASRSPVAA